MIAKAGNTWGQIGTRGLWLCAGLALLWVVLTDGAGASWIVGVPAIAAATAIGLLQPGARWRLSPLGALRFAAFFLRESVKGGVDVAGRVLRPRMRIAPALLDYPVRLPSQGPSRLFFAFCVSLLPGTLVADIGEHTMLVHALDGSTPVGDELARLEHAVAGLFALDLGPAVGALHD